MNEKTNPEKELWNKLYNSKIESLRLIYLNADLEKRVTLLNNLEGLILAPFSKIFSTPIEHKTVESNSKCLDGLQNTELDLKVEKFLRYIDFKKMKCILKNSGGIEKLRNDTELHIDNVSSLTREKMGTYGIQIARWFIKHGYKID